MINSLTISIKEVLNSEMIALRASSEIISKTLEDLPTQTSQVIFDFSAISFMSRSFTQSLLELQEKWRSRIVVNFSNMAPEIEAMMLSVGEHRGQKSADRMRDDLLPKQRDSSNLRAEFFSN